MSMTPRKDRIRTNPADSGQALVEFAMAVTVFLLLVFATIDFGYFYFVKVYSAKCGSAGGKVWHYGELYGGIQLFW